MENETEFNIFAETVGPQGGADSCSFQLIEDCRDTNGSCTTECDNGDWSAGVHQEKFPTVKQEPNDVCHIYVIAGDMPNKSLIKGWLRGTVVERRSLTGELSLSCARPAADE